METTKRIAPYDFILSVLSPQERLEIAFRIAQEAFKETTLVVDTTVLISAFAFGGTPHKAISHLLRETNIYVSPQLLKEYREVPLQLEIDKKINHEQLKLLIVGIASFLENAKVVYPTKRLSICRDLEDNMI